MKPTPADRENQRRWLWLLPLLALLMSVFCVYSSTYLALSIWPTEITHAQMLAENEADYGRDQSAIQFAPLSPQIILQATKDSLGLSITPTPARIDPSHPPVIDNPVQIADVVETPTRELPTAVVSTATHTPRSTSEPATPTPLPTAAASPTPTRETATATTIPTHLPPAPPASTEAPTVAPPIATITPIPQPTWTPFPPPPPASTPTPTPAPTVTAPPPPPTFTPTTVPSAPPTATATATTTATATATATLTPTSTPSPTPTLTPTPTETPTTGPSPCGDNIPGGEPNIGNPNGIIAQIGCGQNFIVDLGAPNAINVTGGAEPAFDLVYYEMENPATMISLDWVIVEVGRSSTGPWVQVFYWGDDILDGNTNIGQAGYGAGSEPDNHPIPLTDLYGGNSTGVAIDVDAFAPAGNYQWVRISTPLGGANDAAEVDSIKSLP